MEKRSMNKICIVVVGYNRPDSISRLLGSLSQADYCGDTVDLYISIDKGARQKEIIDDANRFVWEHGQKCIRAFEDRQGLRKHIIQCGDYVFDYDALVLLEDDITVSKGFYCYVRQAAEFYKDDTSIAGISLYKHHVNVASDHFFEPEFNGYDAFMMQFSQSWGQCWTRTMWQKFRDWYFKNMDMQFTRPSSAADALPDNILHWGPQSWLKYNMAYIVENNLFYVYPYHALSTNHSEIGQHNNTVSSDWQVEMTSRSIRYRFPDLENAVKYDVFFERMSFDVPGYAGKKVMIDLYGNKKKFDHFDYLISTASRPYEIAEKWKLKYRPHELNLQFQEPGNDIFLYDLHKSAKKPKTQKFTRTRYDVRSTRWNELLSLALAEFLSKCIKALKSIFSNRL